MISDDNTWLFNWYYNQCDGDWEHGNAIEIHTIDNPGWLVKISLRETELSNKPFNTVDITPSGNDWTYCSIKNERFQGFCGPFNLPEILRIFRNWAES